MCLNRSVIYVRAHGSDTEYIFNALDTLSMGALKPLAYMRYMRILFLIATSRTDYDTPRDLYARSRHTRTRMYLSPEGLLQTRLRNVSQVQGNSNFFPNYRSFRSRGRLSASMLLSRDFAAFLHEAFGTDGRQSWWNKDGNLYRDSRYLLSCKNKTFDL